jgi:hypothetical protein
MVICQIFSGDYNSTELGGTDHSSDMKRPVGTKQENLKLSKNENQRPFRKMNLHTRYLT